MSRGQMWIILDQDLSTFVCSLCGRQKSLWHLLHSTEKRPTPFAIMLISLVQAGICITSHFLLHARRRQLPYN